MSPLPSHLKCSLYYCLFFLVQQNVIYFSLKRILTITVILIIFVILTKIKYLISTVLYMVHLAGTVILKTTLPKDVLFFPKISKL